MRTKRTKWAVLLGLLLICAFVALTIANGIQTDHGNIVVTEGVIDAYRSEGGAEHLGMLTYKLYTPRTATAENKAPGVLLLHGYQNDRETNAAYAIELARRGVVVLSLDEYGHGFSEPGLKERGYVNHTVKVNYGEESVELGTYKKAGGTVRYRLLMNFSNLSFFNDYYSKDEDGNAIYDSSCGGAAAYAVLATMDRPAWASAATPWAPGPAGPWRRPSRARSTSPGPRSSSAASCSGIPSTTPARSISTTCSFCRRSGTSSATSATISGWWTTIC